MWDRVRFQSIISRQRSKSLTTTIMNTETLIKKLEEIENLALDIKGRFTATVIAVKTKDLIRELSPPANHCHCGAELPTVSDDETPYEFCSEKCKAAAL